MKTNLKEKMGHWGATSERAKGQRSRVVEKLSVERKKRNT